MSHTSVVLDDEWLKKKSTPFNIMQPIRRAAHHSTSSSTDHEANKQKRRNYRLALPQPSGVQRSNPPTTTTVMSQSTHRSQPTLVNTRVTSSGSLSLAIHDRRLHDEEEAESLFRRIVRYCREAKIHFVDDEFPPTDLSLGSLDSSLQEQLQWLRISDIVPSSRADYFLTWSVCRTPEPSDIHQGALGDCWLMAGLALITERPEMLDHILLTKAMTREGVYLVRLCHNGLWKTVLIDDCFPCTIYKQLAFTQANHRQLYVPLIEKACAKLFGSYGDLIGGQTEEGLQLLTGAPCEHIALNPSKLTVDADLIWAKVVSACEHQLLIGASTGRTDVSPKEYATQHIHGNHAFSVLAAHSVTLISMQFVLVRDPHARSNYIDECLTPSILSQMNSLYPHSQSTGAFWISWPKFLRLFNSITISTYAADYYDAREVARFTRSSTQAIPSFQFHVPRTSLVNISLIYHRENRRVRNTHTQSFVLCNVEEGAQKEVGTKYAILSSSRGGYTQWIGSLTPGVYVIIPFSMSFWKENHRSPENYTLVIHSKVQLDVQKISEPPALLADCLIATTLKANLCQSRDRESNFYVNPPEWDFFLFVAENLSSTQYLNVAIDLDDSVRIQHSRQALVTYDSIPPRHRQIIFIVEWANEHGQQAKMDYTFQLTRSGRPGQICPEVYGQNDFHAHRPF